MAKAAVPYIPSALGDTTAAQRLVGRALARAGFGKLSYATRIRRRWETTLTARLNEWRKTAGISNRKPEYTREDHAKLGRFWDEYNHQLAQEELARRAGATREQKLRARVVGRVTYLYNRRLLMRYTQARPYDQRDEPTGLDCSATKAWADQKAGAPQAGAPWGYGNTTSQLEHYIAEGAILVRGRDVYLGVAEPGDPIYYNGHVTVYLGGTRCGSFGSFPMKILDVDYRPDRVAVCALI